MGMHHAQFMNQGSTGGDATLNISGIIAWFDADESRVTKDGSDRVSRVTDMSDTGVDQVQNTATNQPLWLDNQINGKPAIQSQDEEAFGRDWRGMLSESTPAVYDRDNSVSMVIVFEWDLDMDNTSDVHPMFGNAENATQNEGYGLWLEGTSNEARGYVGADGSGVEGLVDITKDTWYYGKLKWDKDLDSGTATYTVNGTSDTWTRTIAIPTSTGALGFGSGDGNTSNSFPGKIAEAILIDHKIDATEEGKIDSYINSKYGL